MNGAVHGVATSTASTPEPNEPANGCDAAAAPCPIWPSRVSDRPIS